MNHSAIIATQLQISEKGVQAVLDLLADGATIPFISRYRKEATGCLNEVQISDIAEAEAALLAIDKRRKTIIDSISEQGLLTDDLLDKINQCSTLTQLEDIYLPFKPRRRTKAVIARENGLEPLSKIIENQKIRSSAELLAAASKHINGNVPTAEAALEGARHIIAENITNDETCRNIVRREFSFTAHIISSVVKGKEDDPAAQKFKNYFDFSEPLSRCPSHRLLAMRRGEAEGILRIKIEPDCDLCIQKLNRRLLRSSGATTDQMQEAINDGFKRLLCPQIETEYAASSKISADKEAIAVFAAGLKQLLMAPPLGAKAVMGIDPGFRTGCKVVCVDASGALLDHDVIFPHPPRADRDKALQTLETLIQKYHLQAIAIGNGTAGRETEQFVRAHFAGQIDIFSVSEDGASVYSASKIARDEFPNHDVTVRGAVSIARRLMDPLAELVKIDSKSIGVGQYQHDVDQTLLNARLDATVDSCVNSVGVDVNTASASLLTHVSGLGPTLAQNIVDYRQKNGNFTNRRQLLNVPRMGAKAFEQSAGFLRIAGGDNPLDNSAVHPESYGIVQQMASDVGCTVKELMRDPTKRAAIVRAKYIRAGEATLNDILAELEKPGRDPRERLSAFAFAENVQTINDLMPGMVLPGIVKNVTKFGAFIDIGVHISGLAHVSQLSDTYVSDPLTVVAVGQHVYATVLDVDIERERISLSLKKQH